MARTANSQKSSSAKTNNSSSGSWVNVTVDAGPLGRLGCRAKGLEFPEDVTFTVGRPYGQERTLSLYVLAEDGRRICEIWIPGLTMDRGPLATAQAVKEWSQLLDLSKVESR
jgi:hypothetical protein